MTRASIILRKYKQQSEELRFWLRWNMALQVSMLDLYITERKKG